MQEVLFNSHFGYLEGLVRGFKNGLLRQADYVNLVQCETLEDIKLHLQSTDYGSFLENEPFPLTVSSIDLKLQEKLVTEFQHLRIHATAELANFLDFISYSYMIDNMILLITGKLHERPIAELVSKCHPLGLLDQMKATYIAENTAELYNAVMLDTPLASLLHNCTSGVALDELEIEIIRNKLYRNYLEAFYEFCENLGGTTAEIMCEILAFEADRRAFTITVNSFNTKLDQERRSELFPRCGKLHPYGLSALAGAKNAEQVKIVAQHYADYRKLFEHTNFCSGSKTLEDKFLEHEVQLNVNSLMQQLHFAVFYSVVKLIEQEARNIVWIAECVAQRCRSKIGNYIPIFP